MQGMAYMNSHNPSMADGWGIPAHRSGILRCCTRRLLTAMISMILIGSSLATAEDLPWSPPTLPAPGHDVTDGRTIVQNTLDFMGGYSDLAFEALVTYGAVQDDGQKIHFDMLQLVAIRLPHHLFWMNLFDDGSSHSAWCNDGEFTLLKQPSNIWGQITVPPTISDAVTRISTEYNIDVPFVDILSGDPAELWLGENVHSVDFIGPAWIDGQWTDHIAIRKPGVDIELWFRQGAEPFPMRIEMVYTTEPQLPSYSARFRKWSTEVPEGSIPKFEPPTDSEKVEVVPIVGN